MSSFSASLWASPPFLAEVRFPWRVSMVIDLGAAIATPYAVNWDEDAQKAADVEHTFDIASFSVGVDR